MIRNFGIAITAVLGITAMLSLWSIAANAQVTTSSSVSGINNTTQSSAGQAIHPKITIISPPKNSSLPIGVVLVSGNASASPGGSAIKDVKVHVDKQTYSNAIPKITGDWSNWSIKLSISIPGPHVIQARVTDIAGNQNWHHVSVNIKGANVNTSSMQALTPTTSNKTAMAAAPTNATAVVPTTSNKTAMAAAPTNATTVVPTTSNKTAMAAAPTNATAVVPTTSNKTAMAAAPTNATAVVPTTSNKTAMAAAPTNATAVVPTTSNKTAMAAAPTNATAVVPTTSNKTAMAAAPTNATAVVPSSIHHKPSFPGIIP